MTSANLNTINSNIETIEPKKTAVLLYGMLRKFQVCAPAFLRHVVQAKDAGVFFFGPNYSDDPSVEHKKNNYQISGKIENPKSILDDTAPLDVTNLKTVYGDALKRSQFHTVPQSTFLARAEEECPRDRWLYNINPARIFSMFYNIEGVVKLYMQHERETGERYDTIIITRPDLAFYSPIETTFKSKKEVHIPDGEGFDNDDGRKNLYNAPVLYYKNIETGDYVPGGHHARFNDQIFMLPRESLEAFLGLYEQLSIYLAARVPASPETLLFLHLIERGGLKYYIHPEWMYEIYRKGFPLVKQVLDTPSQKTAVLLYGMLREFQICAPGFMRHVVQPKNASVFFFGPDQTDNPTNLHGGKISKLFGHMVENPKGMVATTVPIDTAALQAVYGDALKASHFHSKPQSDFVALSDAVCPKNMWLYKLNPARLFSMFYNVEGVVKLYLEHERETGERHDTIIITRPDLAFYGPIDAHFASKKEVHIPDGEGFDSYGRKHIGNAPVLYYKNVETGDYIPGGRHIRFNDQILMLPRESLEAFLGLYEQLSTYLAARVPASPETLLFLHLIERGGLRYHIHSEWVYEIYRKGFSLVQQVVDTDEIIWMERDHPTAVARRKARPVYSALRDAKFLFFKILRRIVR